MKRLSEVLALGITAAVLLAGCESTHHPVVVTPTGEVVVPEQPPPTREETPGKPPSPAYVWAPGYYTYHGDRWVWVHGRWDAPPRQGAEWIPGHWDRTAGGWVWTPGHWE